MGTNANTGTPEPMRIAFLGLGKMGGAMAANLVKRGFTVTGWNRTPDRPTIAPFRAAGGTVAVTLAEAVQEADLIFSCVGDIPDVEAVLLGEGGVCAGAKQGALVVDCSTIGTKAAIAIAEQLGKRGFSFLDAPVSGGDIGAQNGTLTFMVGGNLSDFERCYPYFAAMGKTIRHCGTVGSGQGVKLCNQILAAVHMVALCETMQLCDHLQIDPQLVVEVCGSGAAGSWALSNLGMKVATGDYQAGFAIQHMLKDLRLVMEAMGDRADTLAGVAIAQQAFTQVSHLVDGLEQGTQAMIRAYRPD